MPAHSLDLREYRVLHAVLLSVVIGFYAVPAVLQLLLFARETFQGASLASAFWSSHSKLLLGKVGTSGFLLLFSHTCFC